MKAVDHHREAERLLGEGSAEAIHRAGVHAVLAVAAQLESALVMAARLTTKPTPPGRRSITRTRADE